MAGDVRDEIWAWKGISDKKSTWISFSLLFFGLCERKEIGELLGVEANFNRVRDRWFQTVSLLITYHSLQAMEDFGNFIGILIEL